MKNYKIHLLNYEPERTGGGWTQARYLYEAFGQSESDDGKSMNTYEESDVILITGPTMANHEQVIKAKADGKKIVFRIDNAVRDSRNRGTGMSRMKAFAEQADLVIYQSEWAKRFLYPFTKKDGAVILNGVDTEKFTPLAQAQREESYLYVRSSRDEGKNWLGAWYWFVNNPGYLRIVGKFSPDNLEWNFDFFNNERFSFMGEQPADTMPSLFRNSKYFLYSYICDACSNTLLEARASGCEIIDVFGALKTGGAPEIMECKDISIERMLDEYEQYIQAIA